MVVVVCQITASKTSKNNESWKSHRDKILIYSEKQMKDIKII